MSLQPWSSDTGSVAWLQGLLAAAGFDPGSIDGIYGPRTSSAIAAFQSAHGLPPTGVDDDQTEALLTGGGGAQAAAAPAGATAQDLIRSVYPQIAWAYNIPEVRAVIDQATAQNWDAARIQGAIEATTWWQTTSAAQRTYAQQLAEDPATLATRRFGLSEQIKDQAGQFGFTFTDDLVARLTEQALSAGMTPDQITDMIVDHGALGTPGPGTITATQDQLRQIASQYAVPVSDQTLATWAGQIAGGSQTQQGFLSYITAQAKSLFPGLAAAIDSGQTVSQYVEPYKQIAQQELGINPNSINLLDPKWARMTQQIDSQTGQPAAMSLYDWTRTLRTAPEYGYDSTPQARQNATMLAQSLAQTLGYA